MIAPAFGPVRLAALCALGILAAGCATGDTGKRSTDDAPDVNELRTGDVVLAAGEERYACWSIELGTPLAIVGVDAQLSRVALHHYAVFASDEPIPANPAGYECGSVGRARGLFSGEGRGAPTLSFPDGVALPLPRGQHVVLQLHLLNTSTADVTVPPSSLTFRTAPASFSPAAVMSVVSSGFVVPARSRATVTGNAMAPSGVTRVFAVFPEMRELGTHVTVSVERHGVLVDAPFSAADPVVLPVSTDLTAGDRISLTCDFDNPSDRAVPSGPAADQETCGASLFFYEP